MATKPIIDAPIPGEHYTSDTRKYPWHRPPEIAGYDDTVSYVMERMEDEETAEIVYSLMGIDRPLTNIVSGLLLQGIAKGKFQIDVAILAAGPIYRYLQILADKEGIKYNDGFSEERRPITAETLKTLLGVIDEEEEEPSESVVEAPTVPEEGLMGRPTQDSEDVASDAVQAAMLGLDNEEVDEDVVA